MTKKRRVLKLWRESLCAVRSRRLARRDALADSFRYTRTTLYLKGFVLRSWRGRFESARDEKARIQYHEHLLRRVQATIEESYDVELH
jgi:hypothetical protein